MTYKDQIRIILNCHNFYGSVYFSKENVMLSLVVTGLDPVLHGPPLATLADEVGQTLG